MGHLAIGQGPVAMQQGMPMSELRVALRITGRVQGVAFRAWARDIAAGLGLRGWVRNDPDGAVSGVLAGPDKAVKDMIGALHQGPRLARVDRVEVRQVDEDPGPDLRILR